MTKATVVDPADHRVQLAILRLHARLHSIGMKHSQLTMTDLVEKGEKLFGTRYPRTRAGMVALANHCTSVITELTEAQIKKDITDDKN